MQIVVERRTYPGFCINPNIDVNSPIYDLRQVCGILGIDILTIRFYSQK